MNRPRAKVAIVTRTKNRPTLLRRALDSITSQTYADYVVIVVNDAGERGPIEECVSSISDRAEGRVHVVHNEVSRGREAAMNTGLHAAESQYVVIHDDDDTWAPQFLERTVSYLDEHEDAGGVGVRTAVVHETVDGDSVTINRQELLAANLTDVTLFEMVRRNYVPPISLLYRRAVHDEVGEYDETLPVLADWDFNLRMLGRYDVGFIDGDPLAFWHHRTDTGGDIANSVIGAADDHLTYDRTIRNRYLRDDLRANGHLGSILYFTELIDRAEKAALVRHEQAVGMLHHINIQTDSSSKELEGRWHEANQLRGETAAQLAEMNRNLVTQNNRFVAQLEAVSKRIADLEDLVFSQTPRQRLKSWKALARRKGAGIVRRLR